MLTNYTPSIQRIAIVNIINLTINKSLLRKKKITLTD